MEWRPEVLTILMLIFLSLTKNRAKRYISERVVDLLKTVLCVATL